MVHISVQKQQEEYRFIMTILTQLPIGSKLKVIETSEIVTLEEIRNFPTRYKTITDSGEIIYYKTFEVEVIETNSQSEQ